MEYIVGWDGGISSISNGDNGCEKSWTQQKITMLTKNLSEGMHVVWWLLIDDGNKIIFIFFAMHDMIRFLA